MTVRPDLPIAVQLWSLRIAMAADEFVSRERDRSSGAAGRIPHGVRPRRRAPARRILGSIHVGVSAGIFTVASMMLMVTRGGLPATAFVDSKKIRAPGQRLGDSW